MGLKQEGNLFRPKGGNFLQCFSVSKNKKEIFWVEETRRKIFPARKKIYDDHILRPISLWPYLATYLEIRCFCPGKCSTADLNLRKPAQTCASCVLKNPGFNYSPPQADFF